MVVSSGSKRVIHEGERSPPCEHQRAKPVTEIMRSLVLKIFIWFWAAMALVGMALYFSTRATMSEQAELRERQWIEMTMPLVAQSAADIFERVGPRGLRRYINRLNRRRRFNVSFLNAEGELLAGPVPSARVRNLATKAAQSNDRLVEIVEGERLVAQSVASPAGSRFVLAGNIRARFPGNPPGRPRRPPPILRALGILDADIQTQVLRILAVFSDGRTGVLWPGLLPDRSPEEASGRHTETGGRGPGGPGRKISRWTPRRTYRTRPRFRPDGRAHPDHGGRSASPAERHLPRAALAPWLASMWPWR